MLAWNFFDNFFRVSRIVFSLALLCLIGASFGITDIAFAQEALPQNTIQSDTFGIDPLLNEEDGLRLGSGDIRVVVAQIINVFLGLLGIIVIGIIIYAGFLWMTANGNEDNIAKAKKILVNAVIGLVIILTAFTITQFVLRALGVATGTGFDLTGRRSGQNIPSFSGSGSLGRVVRDHYPFRDQTDVKRNSKIIVTFSQAIDPKSIIENTNQTCWPKEGSTPVSMANNGDLCLKNDQGAIVEYFGDCLPAIDNQAFNWQERCDHVNTDAVRIYPTSDTNQRIQAAGLTMYEGDTLQPFTFVFKPFDTLGDTVPYTVFLSADILLQDGQTSVFTGQRSSYYSWQFTTASDSDFDPPTVIHSSPSFDNPAEIIPRNSIIQITFDEPMDPLTVAGILSSPNGQFSSLIFNTSTVNGLPSQDGLPTLDGTWTISNAYRTVEFIPREQCGQNACGEPMYCLPVDETKDRYHILLRTGKTATTDAQDFTSIPFTGISDIAGNVLDGDRDSVSDGKPVGTHPHRITIPLDNINPDAIDERRADNMAWSFVVENTIDTTAPYIMKILPGIDQEDVAELEDIRIQFSRPMLARSLSDISIVEYPDTLVDDTFWYRARFADDVQARGLVEVDHRAFGPGGVDLYYLPVIPSTVRSLTQHCAYPGRGPIGTPPTQKNISPECVYTEDTDTSVNCVPVTFNEATDTGCIQTTDQQLLPVTQPDTRTCLQQMAQEAVSPTTFNLAE